MRKKEDKEGQKCGTKEKVRIGRCKGVKEEEKKEGRNKDQILRKKL